MAKKILIQYDFSKLEAYNFRLHNLAVAPGAPAPGQLYFDTGTKKLLFHDGTSWIDPSARANHTGTQLAATISDLASTVKAYGLNAFAAPTGNVAMGNNNFTGLAAPSAAGQAAEYAWVLAQVQASAAGIDSKPSVVAVATANQATLAGLPTIDGVTLTAGQRLLLVGQTTASQNGPYLVAAGAWTRDTDALTPQAFWFVEQGALNGGSQWKVATTGAVVPGITALSIVQFGAASTYSNGAGLALSGNVFSVQPAASGGVQVAAAGVSVQLQAGSGLQLGPGGLAVDATVVARKFSTTVGDGVATSIAVNHGLNVQDFVVTARDFFSNTVVDCEVVNTNFVTATLNFAVAPAANSVRVTVIG